MNYAIIFSVPYPLTIAHHSWRDVHEPRPLGVPDLPWQSSHCLPKTSLSCFRDVSGKAPTDPFPALLSPASLFILLVLLLRAFASSQIFLLQAGDFFHVPIYWLRAPVSPEGSLTLPRTYCLVPSLLASRLSSQRTALRLRNHTRSLSSRNQHLLGALFFAIFSATIIKRLAVGYLLLSPPSSSLKPHSFSKTLPPISIFLNAYVPLRLFSSPSSLQFLKISLCSEYDLSDST